MRPRGEDTAAAVREWVKEEIKSGPSSRQELGKFFFAISTASLGALVTFKKLETSLVIDAAVGASLLLLAISALVALFMFIPRKWDLHGDMNLFDEHKKQVRRIVRFIWVWFVTWLLGIAVGIYSVLFK